MLNYPEIAWATLIAFVLIMSYVFVFLFGYMRGRQGKIYNTLKGLIGDEDQEASDGHTNPEDAGGD